VIIQAPPNNFSIGGSLLRNSPISSIIIPSPK
jgi:hypothetical protein